MWVKIRRNQNYSVSECGAIRNDVTGKIKIPTLNKANGYLSLRLKDGKIGRRGITRGWLIEYANSERHTCGKV